MAPENTMIGSPKALYMKEIKKSQINSIWQLNKNCTFMHKHISPPPLSFPPSLSPLSLSSLPLFLHHPPQKYLISMSKKVLFQPNRNSKISSSVPIQTLSYNIPLASFLKKDSLPSILKSSSPNKIDFIMIQAYNTFSKETLDKH